MEPEWIISDLKLRLDQVKNENLWGVLAARELLKLSYLFSKQIYFIRCTNPKKAVTTFVQCFWSGCGSKLDPDFQWGYSDSGRPEWSLVEKWKVHAWMAFWRLEASSEAFYDLRINKWRFLSLKNLGLYTDPVWIWIQKWEKSGSGSGWVNLDPKLFLIRLGTVPVYKNH